MFAVALGSCAALQKTGKTETEGEAAPPVTTSPANTPAPKKRPGAAASSDAKAKAESGKKDTVVASIPPKPSKEPEAAPESPNLGVLIGLEFSGVERLLGPADETTESPPQKTWRYRDGNCALAISFYPDIEALSYRVLSYKVETLTKDQEAGNDDAKQRCRTRFAKRLRPKP